MAEVQVLLDRFDTNDKAFDAPMIGYHQEHYMTNMQYRIWWQFEIGGGLNRRVIVDQFTLAPVADILRAEWNEMSPEQRYLWLDMWAKTCYHDNIAWQAEIHRRKTYRNAKGMGMSDKMFDKSYGGS